MDNCAYCGQPLRLVAGFCATCQAPARVAQRARLIADSGVHAAIRPPVKVGTPLVSVAPLTRPSPIGTRLLLAAGLVALGMVLVFASMRLNANPLRILLPPPVGSLAISQQPGGAATDRVVAGQPFTLRYDVTVDAAQADVSLTITPQHGTARTLEEWWPHGHTQRDQVLIPLAPDLWQVVLRKDGHIVQAATLQIVNPPAP
jgi:hypothetical protein